MDNKQKSGDHSIFTKRTDQNVKLSTDNENENVISGLFDKVKGYVKLSSSDQENIKEENVGFLTKLKNKIKNACEVEKSYSLFFIILFVGLGLIMLSLVFLPVVWISPKKFVSLFSLGSLITIISFVFIYGTSGYLEMLFSKSRFLFSTLFFLSIFIGIYFAFTDSYYIISLICAVLQFITVIVFVLSFIPGGGYGISFIKSMMLSPVYSLWNRLKGASS
jgi:hypothetical protein